MKGKKTRSPRERAHRNQWTQADSRQLKREKKRKGLKAGARHEIDLQSGLAKAGGGKRDPRIGSKKRVPLNVASQAPEKNPLPARQPKIRVAKAEAPAPVASPAKLQAELARLENDERLNVLLDKVDAGIHLDVVDQSWLDKQLARHEELMNLLGLNDAAAETSEDDDDLLARFERNDFDGKAH